MPVCQGCNGSYDGKFKFCPYCGRAKPEPPEPITLNINVTSDDVWETCELECVMLPPSKKQSASALFGGKVLDFEWQFQAIAIGPSGRYSAGCSKMLKGPGFWDLKLEETNDYHYSDTNPKNPVIRLHRDNAQVKLDSLIKELVSDGWQSIGRGEKWWNERFRRKVKNSK